jgi:transcriptional regulator with XRE-family HTH domain
MTRGHLLRAAVWTAGMSKEIYTPRHEALRKLVKLERQRQELTQVELAERLGWDQTTVSHIETGSKRVTVIELIELSEALDFDLCAAIQRIAKVRD